MKSISGTHKALYRVSGGRIGGRMKGMPVLLLITRGRRSRQVAHHSASLPP